MSYTALKRQLGLNDELVYSAPGTSTGNSTKTFAPAPKVYIAPSDPSVVAKYVQGSNQSLPTNNKSNQTGSEVYQVNVNKAQDYSEFEKIRQEEQKLKQEAENRKAGITNEPKTDVMEYVKWGAIGAGTLLVLAIIFK